MKCFNYFDQGCRCLNLDDKEKLDKVVKTTHLDSGVYVFFRDDRQKSDWRSIKSIDWRSKAWLSCKRIGGENMKKIYFIFANK